MDRSHARHGRHGCRRRSLCIDSDVCRDNIIGRGAAIILFAIAGLVSRWFAGTAGADQTAALFGSFSIGLAGYIAVLLQVALIAVVTALTSRHTVNSTLEAID